MPALRSPLLWQVSVAPLLLAGFTLMPPARGALLLVPIRGDAGAAVRVGVAAGASLVRIGPWPGSVIMWGDRAALAGPLRAAGVLMLAAPPGGCADGERERLS